MLQVSDLFIYPIKSLGGIPVSAARVTEMGLEYDRRWMLVDSDNCAITQREIPAMCMLQVELSDHGFRIYNKRVKDQGIILSPEPEGHEKTDVKIFDDTCGAVYANKSADQWFSEILNVSCRFVFIPEEIKRPVDTKYAHNGEHTGFSDGFPFLIIGQSSFDDLNKRLPDPLSINRFRPNIVFTGGYPYQEDNMVHFRINEIDFFGVKPCARCAITTVNPDNGMKSPEPLKTLAQFRQKDNKVYFGQNLLSNGTGLIKTGDPISIISQTS
jgi:MOSC domain-containing protein